MRTLKLPLNYVAFAIGFVFMLSSCQKQNEETLKTNTQSTPTFQSLTEIIESGIDIESLGIQESTTSSSDYSTSSRAAGLTFFSDPAEFAAACPDLPTEDFEEGVGYIEGFAGPLDESSSNAVFSPGDILPGVSFNSNAPQGGYELVFVDETAGFGNPGAAVLANFFVDSYVINFTASDVTGVSMDVVDISGLSDVIVEIFGSSGSLGSIGVPSTPSGVFLGIMSSEAITMITIYSPDDGAEGVDNISFGTCIVDSDGDGCPDDTDPHPNSIQDPMVVIDGCDSGVENVFVTDCSTMSDFIADCAASATNHGDFVSCVAHLTNEWKAAGLISGKEKGAIQSCAAGANIPSE